ncbi:imm68 putative immunity domain-containing protein [Brevibacillus brevis]|uniref:imm68 putative immunity domain-containing protein n=1 Tax=Brevibacillus sp. HB1.1 TaxID=2738808 RepID=UPI00037BC5E3
MNSSFPKAAFLQKNANGTFRVELNMACSALIDPSAIVLESHKSGYVDLHDLDEDRQPYELAELVPADDMRELAEKAKMIADELAPLS